VLSGAALAGSEGGRTMIIVGIILLIAVLIGFGGLLKALDSVTR
jgi:hypothetical protein